MWNVPPNCVEDVSVLEAGVEMSDCDGPGVLFETWPSSSLILFLKASISCVDAWLNGVVVIGVELPIVNG